MYKTISLLFLCLAFTTSAAETEQLFVPGYYAGINLGSAKMDGGSGLQDFSYLNVGFNGGYQYTSNFSAELYASFSSTGKKDDYVSSLLGTEVKAEQNVAGIYAVAKTSGAFYGKARLGIAQSRFSYSAGGYEDDSNGDIGLSYGVGVGITNENISCELEYIIFPTVDDPIFDNTDYDISILSLGLSWAF